MSNGRFADLGSLKRRNSECSARTERPFVSLAKSVTIVLPETFRELDGKDIDLVFVQSPHSYRIVVDFQSCDLNPVLKVFRWAMFSVLNVTFSF